MAFSGRTTHGSATEKTSDTTLAISVTTNNCAADRLLLVAVACDNIQTTDGDTTLVSITDTKSNTYTRAKEFTNGQGAAAAGATVALFYSKTATQLVAGTDTINIAFSSAVTAKCAFALSYAKGSGTNIEVDGTASLANDAADPGSLTATGTNSGEHVWWRLIASEVSNTTALTPTAGWAVTDMTPITTTGGGGATNMRLSGEHKIATGTGSGASDPTYQVQDHASIVCGFIESAASFTGTISRTTGNTTSAASGTETFTGTISGTLGNASLSASGTNYVLSGTISATLANTSSAASGTQTFTGSLSSTVSNASVSASGLQTFTGTTSGTTGNTSVSATGSEIFTGTASATTGNTSSNASGTETFSGSASATTGAASSSITALETFTGTSSGTFGNTSLTAAGRVGDITGTIAATIGAVSASLAGAETFAGTVTVTIAGASVAATGSEIFTGAISSTAGNASVAATGSEIFSGLLNSSIQSSSIVITGAEAFISTISATITGVTAAASGTVSDGSTTGTISASTQSFTVSIAGTVAEPRIVRRIKGTDKLLHPIVDLRVYTINEMQADARAYRKRQTFRR